jgi:RND family efflux transporter MFP subunit
MRIVAPFDGVVARKLADVGDLAMPGKPLLELEGRSGLRLVADVPLGLARALQPGTALAVHIEHATNAFTGTVAEVAPAADPATRTLRAKVDLPESTSLRAGQFGRLAVPAGESRRLLVPPAAMIQRGQLDLLYVAVDGRAQLRVVRVGESTPQGLEILAGLSEGESVVVEGVAGLRDGQPLTTR